MRYYIPTSTLNISNILSSGSISPYSYYGKRQFGIKSFEPIKECEKFKDQIILFRNYPLFSIVSDKESYPVCIEIEIPDNMVIPSNIPDVFYVSKTIYISPSNITFVFENEEYLKKSLFWIDISDEAKFFDQYKAKFILRGNLHETFTLTSNTLDNLIIEQTLDVETEVMKDWKIDKIRGAMCGMFIGANGFDGLDGTGVGYKRNLIKSIFSQLLHIFDGRAQLVTQTSQLEMSALSEFAKKEQRIRQLCSVSTLGQLKILYNEDKKERVDFYNQLLNRILVNSDSLTQQGVSQEGGKLLSTLYGNRWKSSFDYSYLIQLYNNVTRYDNFDLDSNESIILRSFAAFVQRGIGEWDKLRDYLNERNETLPDRRFIYGLYGAVSGFSTLSKTLTDTADISDKALNEFIFDMNESSMIDNDNVAIGKKDIEEVKDDPEVSSKEIEDSELLGAKDEIELHVWQQGIKQYATNNAIKRDKKKLSSTLEEALIENGNNTDYFVFLKLLATYEGWSSNSKGPNTVWLRMQEHFVPDYFSRLGIIKPKAIQKEDETKNSPSLFGSSFEGNEEVLNIKKAFYEDNNAWDTIRTMIPLQIRERTQKDFMWLQQEYQKGDNSKYYAKASRDNSTVIEALRRLLLKRDYIRGIFEQEVEQIIQFLHNHYDQ